MTRTRTRIRDYRSEYERRWGPCSKCGKNTSRPAMTAEGLCPRCAEPELYAECQRIAKADKPWQNPRGSRKVEARLRNKERGQLAHYVVKMRRRPVPLPIAEALLGPTPTANSGKVGGGPNNGRGQ